MTRVEKLHAAVGRIGAAREGSKIDKAIDDLPSASSKFNRSASRYV